MFFFGQITQTSTDKEERCSLLPSFAFFAGLIRKTFTRLCVLNCSRCPVFVRSKSCTLREMRCVFYLLSFHLSSSYFSSLYSICVSEAKCSFVMYRTSSSCIPCVIPSVPFFVMSYHPFPPFIIFIPFHCKFFVSLVSFVRKRDKRVVLSSFFYFMYTLLAFDRVKCSLMDVFSSHPLRHHESATHISS